MDNDLENILRASNLWNTSNFFRKTTPGLRPQNILSAFSFICMHVLDAHDISIYIYYIPICKHCAILKVIRYLEHIYTYNHTTCRNILSARNLWNTCDLLQLGWLGSYSVISKVSNWINNGVYIYIHIRIHMYMIVLSCLHVQSIPIAHRNICSYYSMCTDFVKRS